MKSEAPAPVMLLIHGGGWSIGDKAHRTFIEPKASWLIPQGFIVASINYRLSPAVTHPAHIEDVCSAIGWIERNIAKHGENPTKLWLLGTLRNAGGKVLHVGIAEFLALFGGSLVDGQGFARGGKFPFGDGGLVCDVLSREKASFKPLLFPCKSSM